jgi:spore maturation protein B
MLASVSFLIVPFLLLGTIILAIKKKVNGYDIFIDGVKEGMGLFKEVFPTLVATVSAVAILRGSGIISDIADLVKELFNVNGEIVEIIPMVLFRPISGSASMSVFNSICSTNGPDSFLCKMSAIIQGSTDTTLYVLSLYFSSIGITKWKHALHAGLIADVVGISIGIVLSIIFFGI